MKKVYRFIITITLLFSAISPLQAQNIGGKDFWITFNELTSYPPSNPSLRLQIRIVSGNSATTGTIHFTSLGTSIPFTLGAHEVYTHPLTTPQIEAVYNSSGISNYSIHITSVDSVSVYTYYGLSYGYGDATNILPTTTLGTEYYQISYGQYANPAFKTISYAVVATQNNTQVFHDGGLVATLNKGQVYMSNKDNEETTGAHITANSPVAFFSFNDIINITSSDFGQQQFPPVNNWGKTFFVPKSPHVLDRVRVVATQNNTNIIQIVGGTILTGIPGAQTNPNNLQAGQFIELQISSNGCYIKADQPVGVCSFLSGEIQSLTVPSQCWIPAIEQTIQHALIAPFYYLGQSQINNHYAFICVPTADKGLTRVSIGGAPPTNLFGGSWIDHATAQMSFYRMPLTSNTASYNFSNPTGLIVLCYGDGVAVSYYYPAGFATRNLSAAFTANNIPYDELHNNPFCEHDITFVANIEGIHPNPGSLKWYINGALQPALTDQLTWTQNFATGNHVIKMSVLFEDNSTEIYEDTLKIKNCEAVFYANGVLSDTLHKITFCDKVVYFQADVEGLHSDPGRLKWYINGTEVIAERDHPTWNKTYDAGEHHDFVELVVVFENGETKTLSGTVNVRVFWTKIRNIRN